MNNQIMRMLIREYAKDEFLSRPAAYVEELDYFRKIINSSSSVFVSIAVSRGLTASDALIIAKMMLALIYKESGGAKGLYYVTKNPLDIIASEFGADTTYGPGQFNPSLLSKPEYKDVIEKYGIDPEDITALIDERNELIIIYTALCNNFSIARRLSKDLDYQIAISFAAYNAGPEIIRDYYDVGLTKDDGSTRAIYDKKVDPKDGKLKLFDAQTGAFYSIENAKLILGYIPEFQAQDNVSKAIRQFKTGYANSKQYTEDCVSILKEIYPGV